MDFRHLITVFGLLLAANVGATTVGFGCITASDPSGVSCSIAESQLTLTVGSFDKANDQDKHGKFGKRDDHDKYGKHDDHGMFDDHDMFDGHDDDHGMFDDSDDDHGMFDDSDDDHGMFDDSDDHVGAIPVPGAVWLFGSGLLVLAGLARRRTP